MPGAVASLHVYPVKSCRGTSLTSARVGQRGIEHDRRWMIVDEAGTFITQRDVPRLARVDVQVGVESLELAAEGHGSVRVAVAPPRDATRRLVRVWKAQVDAVDCGSEVAGWLSEWIGKRASLVFLPDDSVRPVAHDKALPGDHVGFADGFPVLVTTAASLDDLNARLADPVPMDRFRPNVVVAGGTAWEEDSWQRVRVGPVPLRVVKPCERCVVTTTDQRTGEGGVEPLRTLATFRRRDAAVLFGQNCIPDDVGTVRLGDPLEVLE
jgi:uncharacterized protein YcbX